MVQRRSLSRDGIARLGHRTWHLQEAKARFSELFRLARSGKPKMITRKGKESVVLLCAEEYEELVNHKKGPRSLVDFFATSPLAGAGLNFRQDPDAGRDIGL